MKYDLIIRGGRYFDGHQTPSTICDVGILDGVVKTVARERLDPRSAKYLIDANNKWVMPGFVDIHTHYEVEILVAPSIRESVRHGITTVITGNCSLSTVFCDALDCADMFARVEALPRTAILSALSQHKTWDSPKGWIERLKSLPLGPNVACMLGHSDLRAHVLTLSRSVTKQKPSQAEKNKMAQLLSDALDEGFVGMSTMTNPWDKLDGDRFLSSALPSIYASWSEYGFLCRILRERKRVLQSAPNLNTKVNLFLFFLQSMKLPWRAPLKTTLISAGDPKASLWLATKFGPLTNFLNRLLSSHVVWQALPVPFEIYADGMELVVFEEFGAGEAALHIRDEILRNELLKTKDYRRAFRRDIEKRFSPRIWHRDFYDAHIIACPDPSLVGRSFGNIADERSLHAADLFLDLVVDYGAKLRWKTTIANHRPEILKKLVCDDNVHIGFADSGAHLRNMGFYNFPLHLLKMARDAEVRHENFMSVDKAVFRLTHELADWFNLDAGSIKEGKRADIAIINPDGLDESLSSYHEEPFLELDGISRMVRRNDRAVVATIIDGKIAYHDGKFAEDFGVNKSYGRFLSAK